MLLNQLNFHDFDFDLKSSQIWFYPTLYVCENKDEEQFEQTNKLYISNILLTEIISAY